MPTTPMTLGARYRTTLLFLGDIVIFFVSLWLTLLVRYGSLPSESLFNAHAVAFFPLFLLWLLVFYMAGLYGKHAVLFKSALTGALFRVQLANIILAALYFFLVPGIGLAPKTNLLIYLVASLALILSWRLFIFPSVSRPSSRERAALVADGPEADELFSEVNANDQYRLAFAFRTTPAALAADFDAFSQKLSEERVSMLVVDTEDDALRPHLGRLYALAFLSPGYPLADFSELYEEVFDRVPLTLLEYEWFLKNTSLSTPFFYPLAKRIIDIAGALVMGLITLIAAPFVALALRLESPGPVFIRQRRLGRNGSLMTSFKFRSMLFVDRGMWPGEGENKVTKVGAFLRSTSLDEFPQFINILRGELSLIGPRNDLEALGKRLADELPYYGIRYTVLPGITGWAQINQQYAKGNPQSVDETKVRLAYDFYYLKHRSLALDIVIALKTVKRMLFRAGS